MFKQVINGILISASLCSSLISAAEFHGSLGAQGGIRWTNAIDNDPYYYQFGVAPTAWSLANERATSEWYPGSYSNDLTYDVKFSDFAGNEFTTTVDILAITYMLGSSANYFVGIGDQRPIAEGFFPTCDDYRAESALEVVGHYPAGGCVTPAGFKTKNGERAEPFKFYRPTIGLFSFTDDIDGMPAGRYTASLTTYPVYFYKSESDVLTKTQMIEPIIITIDYVPAELTAVNLVSGDGIMEPIYNKAEQRISGSTVYEVEMIGTLPSGVIMNFTEYTQSYEMVSSSEASVKVPYSITCIQGCVSADKEIVKDGVFNTASFTNGNVISESTPDGGNSVKAKYQISYDVAGDDIISSDYSGQFTVMYEVNL